MVTLSLLINLLYYASVTASSKSQEYTKDRKLNEINGKETEATKKDQTVLYIFDT